MSTPIDSPPAATTELDEIADAFTPEGVPEMIARLTGANTSSPYRPMPTTPPAPAPIPSLQRQEAEEPDAPCEGVGGAYTREQAAEALGVSSRRVSQLAAEGNLEVVQATPLLVSAVSVENRRVARAPAADRPSRSVVQPKATVAKQVADQVERIVALVIAEKDKAMEVEARLLAEVSQQRDHLKIEVVRLRAQLDAERRERQVLDDPKARTWRNPRK